MKRRLLLLLRTCPSLSSLIRCACAALLPDPAACNALCLAVPQYKFPSLSVNDRDISNLLTEGAAAEVADGMR